MFAWVSPKIIVASILMLSFGGCSSTGRYDSDSSSSSRGRDGKPRIYDLDAQPGKRIWVVKPDGSKSCAVKRGITAKRAASVLKRKGLQVIRFRKAHDGKMRMQVCGADTGNQVELLVDGAGLPLAGKNGYRLKTRH